MKNGKLLTSVILSVGEERDCVSNKGVVITKTEKLARLIWSLALGDVSDEEGVARPPDKEMIKLLYERIEGRTGTTQETRDKMSAVDKVSEQAKNRIAGSGGIVDDSSRGT